jgi:hypothetical protein
MLRSRLERLTPVLSGKERAVLIVRAKNQGVEPDPDLFQSITAEQRPEYNRYVALDYVANHQLGMIVNNAHWLTLHLQEDFERLSNLNHAAAMLEEQFPDEIKKQRVRQWRKAGDTTVTGFLRQLWFELRDSLLSEAESLWQELRAEQIVQAEIAAEFDGEDPVVTETREKFRETKKCLDKMLGELAGPRKRKRQEPDEAMLDRYRDIVDGTFQKLGLIKDL